MNRRDIIVVAVLINVCIVVVMLISAVKHTPQDVLSPKLEIAEAPVVAPVETGAIKQVEEVLSAYKEKKPEPVAVVAQPKVMPTKVVEVTPVKDEGALMEISVESGDMLEKIARKYRISVDELMKLNQLTSTRLKVGQVLYVPKNAPKKVVAKEQEGKFYTVKNGDSPWTIAVKNHMRVEELLELNKLNEKSAKKLKPGDRLKIR